MKKTPCLCLLLLLCLLLPLTAWPGEKILRVGVAPGEPFVIVNGNQYEGIAINIWKMIAQNLNIKYQFVPMSQHIDDDIKQLANNRIDMLIGPIIPTAERMRLVDFTKPYYLNQIGIVVPVKKIPFFATLIDVLIGSLSWLIAVLLCIFILYIHIFWFFERKKGYMNVESNYWPGIKTTFWLHTLGISFNQIPTHTYTRVLRLILFMSLIILLSTITASITSSLTVALANNYVKHDKLSDFSNETVAAVIHAAPYDLGTQEGLNIIPTQSRTTGINLLLNGKVAGFADSYAVADYYLRRHQLTRRLTMANAIIAQNTFSFALPINSPLRHQINLQLDILLESKQIEFLCKSLLGEKSARNCDI